MNSKDTMKSGHKGVGILVIYAMGHPPDEAALAELLSTENFKLAIPENIVDGSINPKDFDCIIVILTEELEVDKHLEDCMLIIARCGSPLVGVWGKDVISDKMHPAVRKYGIQQVPWNPEAISRVIGSNIPQVFQSSTGKHIEQAVRHERTYNKCKKAS